MDVAAQFQASYMRTTGFIVPFDDDLSDETFTPLWSKTRCKSKAKAFLLFDLTNPRADVGEAMVFIKGSTWSDAEEEIDPEEHYTLVQLLSPTERRNLSPSASLLSTFISPSPLRPRKVPNSLRYGIRPVANPVLLRSKVLQNICAG